MIALRGTGLGYAPGIQVGLGPAAVASGGGTVARQDMDPIRNPRRFRPSDSGIGRGVTGYFTTMAVRPDLLPMATPGMSFGMKLGVAAVGVFVLAAGIVWALKR